MSTIERIRELGRQLAEVMDELNLSDSAEEREAGGALDDALNHIDAALQSLGGDGDRAADGELVIIDDLHGQPASAAMARKHLTERHDTATQDLSDPELMVVHFDEHFNNDVDDHPL